MADTHYIVFTDGSSLGNPGPGGWGAIVVMRTDQSSVIELGGHNKKTTNNRMELTAAAQALAKISSGSSVTIYTDSSYLINGITKWISGWKRNGWQTKTKDDVLNKDIWQEIDAAISGKTIVWKYVGGHIGVAGNERCDEIATKFAAEERVELYKGRLDQYSVQHILDISHDVGKMAAKSASSSRSSAKAYSYLSRVGGVTKIHRTWAECEARVKGVTGARFRNAVSPEEQEKILQEFNQI